MTKHHPRCIENALGAIAENNAATLATEPGRTLTPETETEAIEWLSNGNYWCLDDGELCQA